MKFGVREEFISFREAFKGFPDLFLKFLVCRSVHFIFWNSIFSLICAQIYFTLILNLYLTILLSPYSYSFGSGWLFVSFCNLLCSTHFIAFRRRKIASARTLSPSRLRSSRCLRVGIVCNKNTINYSPNFMNFYRK